VAELRVEGLTKSYGDAAVVQDVSFTVPSGRFFALLGPSGSGKTTILRIISGFALPDAGRVYVDGDDVTALAPERRQMGVVFQNYALFPHMTVWHNIAFGLEVRGVPAPERARRIRDALALTHLDGLENRRPGQLSGGQQQRVALARALVVQPRLLLLDEPLSALDTRIRVEMRSELMRIQRESGVTAVIVTHDQEEAMELADSLLVLEGGRTAQGGRPHDVYTHPASERVATFMGRSNEFDGEARALGASVVVSIGEGVAWTLDRSALKVLDGDAPRRVRVGFRPERVRVLADGGGDGAARGDGATLDGRVAAVRFDGPVSRIDVRAGSLSVECLLLSREAEGLAAGSAIRLFVPARDVRVFPAADAANEEG
jgi:ABC-type Fe3+/spermidine/putrescine transport system ATPase subunit